ncbi:MAG: PilC/PilY family type IV pilus protein [Pseudomonadota bacterium]
MNNINNKFLFFIALFALAAPATNALEPIPDIAQAPLLLSPTTQSNVMILRDDSGSMDYEVMTADTLSSGLFFAPNPDGTGLSIESITHRPGCELRAAALGGYAYGIAAPTNLYVDSTGGNCYVAAQDAWRFRCSTYNSLYYDPQEIYEPWVGTRSDGIEFADIEVDFSAAPLDPTDPNSATVNLISPDPDTGIDAFRFYTCSRTSNTTDPNFTLDSETIITADFADIQNFYNWFVYHRSRQLRAKSLLGDFIANESGTRIGLVNFNSANLPAVEMNESILSGNKATLLQTLYSSNPVLTEDAVNISSPLEQTFQATRDYLACEASSVFPNIGAGLPGNEGCPALSAPAGSCQPNHIIVASDGFYDLITGVDDNDADEGGNPFDGGFLADGFSNTFADVAISFYKEDLQSGLIDDVTPDFLDRIYYEATPTFVPLASDATLQQHIKTHAITFDSGYLNSQIRSAIWYDPAAFNLGLVKDLFHATINARGQYFDFNRTRVNQLSNLTATVSADISSTTPVAINTQATADNAVLYRTFYDSVSLSGDLAAQEINPDGSLAMTSDGAPDFLWSAAEELDDLVGINGAEQLNRNIFTYSSNSRSGTAFQYSVLNSTQQSQLNDGDGNGQLRLNYLRGDTANQEDILEGPNPDEDKIFRIRPETTSTGGGVVHFSKLGTIANAAPIFVGTPNAVGRFGGAWPSADGQTYLDFQTQQADREASVLSAANDGMLHVFDAENGSERFAYVPDLVFSKLSVFSDPAYRHQFYVDATPAINDAYISADGSASPSWNTVLVGGLGAGGRGYYALNITDQESFTEDDVMWEFGPADDPNATTDTDGKLLSDLGLSFGTPVITMSNSQDGSGNQRWVAIFGNGYNSTSVTGNAVIYMLFIDEGFNGWSGAGDLIKIDTGAAGIGTPNGISDVRAVDVDGNGTVDRLYAGDLLGNLHVVDVSSANENNWNDSDNRFILFEARYSETNEIQPITTRPVVVNNERGDGFVVVFTTGRFFAVNDATDTSIQSIYGVIDDGSNTEVIANNLVEQVLTNEVLQQSADDSIDVRVVSDNSLSINDDGWFIDFDALDLTDSFIEFPGERAVGALQLRGGTIFTNTIIPLALSCEPPSGGFSLALDPQTGTSGGEPIFDFNIDGEFDVADNIIVADVSQVIVSTRFESPPLDSTFFNDFRVTQLSDTSIDSIRVNNEANSQINSDLEGRQAWREVEF